MIFVILFLGLILRVLLFTYWTHPSDMGLWIYWGGEISRVGFNGFFDQVTWTDYLPFYFYILWTVEKVSQFLPQLPIEYLHKIPSSLADIATSFFIYKILKKKDKRLGLFGGFLYAFNPAIIFNSALWGQVDGIGALFLISSIYFWLAKKRFLTGVILGVAVSFKPLFVFAVPIFLLANLKIRKPKFLPQVKFLVGGLLSSWLVALPFVLSKSIPSTLGLVYLPFQLLFARYQVSVNQYPYTSVNAFNFWAIGDRWWQSDVQTFLGLSYQHWGGLLVLLALGVGSTAVFRLKQKKEALFALIFTTLFLALFVFATRAHERHMLTALAPLSMLAAGSVPFLIAYLLLSISYFLNLHFALQWLLQGGKFAFDWNVINGLSLLNSAISIGFIFLVFGLALKSKRTLAFLNLRPMVKKLSFGRKAFLLGLTFLLLLRLFRLDYPPEHYFDEVYHAFTAQEIVKGNTAAWEYWMSPPEGFAYEWTHPPLAKLFMVGGIFLLGDTPVGWRLPGALFGLVSVYLVYSLAKQIFAKRGVSLLAAGLYALEGLPFVMSRIGMADVYFLVFSLATLLFYLKKKYFWSAVFLGLALATKWTALFLVPILAVAWLLYERRVKKDYLWYVLLPLVIYFASYTPFFLTGHTLGQWWETQRQMWWYHTNLEATHPYASPWWSWPINGRPTWLFTEAQSGRVSNIYALGNPIIFWGGLASVLVATVRVLKKRKKELLLVLAGYFLMFLPWAASPRIMFIHHYLPAVPFLVLLLAWLLARLWELKRKLLVTGYLLLVLLGFILYYPLWTGLPVPSWWASYLIP